MQQQACANKQVQAIAGQQAIQHACMAAQGMGM